MNYNKRILEADFIVDMRDKLPRHASKKWRFRDPDYLEGVCYHQSLEEHGRASGNARYHSNPNHISNDGLPGLSYTMFVEKDGRVILANDVEAKTYSHGYRDPAGRDENELYIGVCFGGHFSGPGYRGTQAPTESQMQVARLLWGHLSTIWNWGPECLFGHFDFGKPACPGYELMGFVESIRPQRFDSITSRQSFLMKMSFYMGAIDGIWGPMSKEALVKFQRYAGTDPDGVWGRKTSRAAMREWGHV